MKRIRNMKRSRIGWGDPEEVELFLGEGDWRSAGFIVPYLYHTPHTFQRSDEVYKIKITIKVMGKKRVRQRSLF